jgi:hypothetical protein
MKDLKKESETESNTDSTELFWNKSESNIQLDNNVNDTPSAEAPYLTKKSLFSSAVNNLNICKYDEDDQDNSCHPIELYMNDYNPIKSPKNDNLFGVTDMFNWNEVFNMSSNYVNPQNDDYPVCDYFKLLEDPMY